MNRTKHGHTLLLRLFSEKERFSGKEHYFLLDQNQTGGVQTEKLPFPFKCKSNYPFRIVGSCCGLICLSDDNGDHPYGIILWNPSIRKFKKLPRPRVTHLTHGKYTCVLGFGFDRQKNDYKVVRLAYVKGRNGRDLIPPEVEVYGLNSGAWRSFNAGAPPYGILDTLFTRSQAFASGAIHWIGYDPCKGDCLNKLIVSFDIGNEVFGELMLPNCLVECEDLYVAEYGELLSMFEMKRRGKELYFNVWVMREYGFVESWMKLYSLDICEGVCRPIGFKNNEEVLYVTARGKLVSFNQNTIQTKGFGIKGATDSFYVGSYMESLVLLDGESAVLGADAIICDGGDEHEDVLQWPRAESRQELSITHNYMCFYTCTHLISIYVFLGYIHKYTQTFVTKLALPYLSFSKLTSLQ